ncbi:MAG: PEP-CTERM sorting domain-containing protein [Burkholderiales bacterium]
MMLIFRAALAVIAAFVLSTSAHAAAWTQLDMTGAINLSQGLYETGGSFQLSGIPYTVRVGEPPQRFTLEYNLSMADSGLPVTLSGPELARYSTCNFPYPVIPGYLCPPPPTGYESAFARLSLIAPHENTPPSVMVAISSTAPLDVRTQRGPEPDFISQSGTITVDVSMVEGWANLTQFSGVVFLNSDQWVVSSPIPEPETYALMLGGLGAVLLRRRQSRV